MKNAENTKKASKAGQTARTNKAGKPKKAEETEEVSRILEEEMKGAAHLSVELEVDMHQGNNWYEAK